MRARAKECGREAGGRECNQSVIARHVVVAREEETFISARGAVIMRVGSEFGGRWSSSLLSSSGSWRGSWEEASHVSRGRHSETTAAWTDSVGRSKCSGPRRLLSFLLFVLTLSQGGSGGSNVLEPWWLTLARPEQQASKQFAARPIERSLLEEQKERGWRRRRRRQEFSRKGSRQTGIEGEAEGRWHSGGRPRAGGVEGQAFWGPEVSFKRPIGDRLVERGERDAREERKRAGSAVWVPSQRNNKCLVHSGGLWKKTNRDQRTVRFTRIDREEKRPPQAADEGFGGRGRKREILREMAINWLGSLESCDFWENSRYGQMRVRATGGEYLQQEGQGAR
jgi:hypothetical protein